MLRLSEPYQARRIRFLDLWNLDGWRMKAYSIACERRPVDDSLIAAARLLARRQLPAEHDPTQIHGVGFIGIHEAKNGNFVFIDWWAHENELQHRFFASSAARPTEFSNLAPTGLIASIWDLAVISYERDAWVEAVLRNSDHPDIEAYLTMHMNVNV